MKRIGVFGSAFNPIHIGHLIMVEQAIERLNLDKVLLVPTKSPYHKKVEMIDFDHRYKMTVIESSLNDRIEASDIEKYLDGNSYTFDMINLLKDRYPNDSFYFIMGSDSLINFEKWYKSKELKTMINFIVFQRPDDKSVSNLVDKYKSEGLDISYFEDLQIQISSTYIRDSIKKNRSVKYLLSDRIIDFIRENGLYE